MSENKSQQKPESFLEEAPSSFELQSYLFRVRTAISNAGYLLRLDREKQDNIRNNLIFDSFTYHYLNNGFYRDLCNDRKVSPENVREEGVENIPVIPVNMFKNPEYSHLLLTMAEEKMEMELFSTGTSGVTSIAKRDRESAYSLGLMLTGLYTEFLGIIRGFGLFLCPSIAEAPGMGMVKGLNFLSGLLDDRSYLVRRYEFSAEEAINTLKDWEKRLTRHIVGPPFMINRLLRYIKDNNIKIELDEKSYIIMMGGWKKYTGEEISREAFNQSCMGSLGVESHRIRDIYAMVESNLFAIECEKNIKHIPPWIRIVMRDPDDPQRIVRNIGESGRISILDPTNLSYPCFIETEDVGHIPVDACSCQRISQTMAFETRISGAEVGCCAINLERYMDENEMLRSCGL
uniref:Long-chain-fatty-acid---luciferin-component ligase n=1 Tax=Candidatus Kentrum sp. LFY TaxID=2126342 RepID=A0A450UG12_9GAMM|nr:MAG: long-chain-fatty-acid---luciferin-component ligase [Candidatus Kentron sp. LFY]